jgi:hypothetical protein
VHNIIICTSITTIFNACRRIFLIANAPQKGCCGAFAGLSLAYQISI